MKLEIYLARESLSVADFAEKIGVKRQTVYSYINRQKVPSPETMKLIGEKTDGEVMPNDFYDFIEQGGTSC